MGDVNTCSRRPDALALATRTGWGSHQYRGRKVAMDDRRDVLGLTRANGLALAHVRARAERDRSRHLGRIESVLISHGIDTSAAALLDALGADVAVTLNFHPDRLLADGRAVAQALYDEGVYRSQFETGISNGALTAYPDGERDVWERSLFAGAYQALDVRLAERPKYGGLNLMNNRNGACPRFGSCHLRLGRAATGRTTLVFGDSASRPDDLGLIDDFAPVLAPLLESIAAGAGALGRAGVDVRAFVAGVLNGDHRRARGVFAPTISHALNDYVEAHVHGELRLARDVEAVVIDPAFDDTPDGELLVQAAERYGLRVERHEGLAVALADVPDERPDLPDDQLMRWQAFCGDGRARRFAERVVAATHSAPRLDAANIGRAAVSAVREPARWREWGESGEVLVHLKDLWLLLVAQGTPRAPQLIGSKRARKNRRSSGS